MDGFSVETRGDATRSLECESRIIAYDVRVEWDRRKARKSWQTNAEELGRKPFLNFPLPFVSFGCSNVPPDGGNYRMLLVLHASSSFHIRNVIGIRLCACWGRLPLPSALSGWCSSTKLFTPIIKQSHTAWLAIATHGIAEQRRFPSVALRFSEISQYPTLVAKCHRRKQEAYSREGKRKKGK